MAQRPGFPLKLDKATPAPRSLKAAAAIKPSASPAPAFSAAQSLGMDSSAVRQRMVQKLAAQGLQDPMVPVSYTHLTLPTKP
jgi:protein-L-isoaspartate(D-aspartate) O-methyltransferase